jgi:FkbM family methyltransferase
MELTTVLDRYRHWIVDVLLEQRSRIRPRRTLGGVVLPLDRQISPALRRRILTGTYESHELTIVKDTLESTDTVLECGAGIGLLATYCARQLGSDRVTTFEANPQLHALISHTFQLNAVSPRLIIGAIGASHGYADFFIRYNFWASSSHVGRAKGSKQTITVPVCPLHDAVVRCKPTYLFIDIEGAEADLAGCSDLPGVTKLMAEVHPELIGDAGVARFTAWLHEIGFRKDADVSTEREIFLKRT